VVVLIKTVVKWVLHNPQTIAFIMTFIIKTINALSDKRLTKHELDELKQDFEDYVETL